MDVPSIGCGTGGSFVKFSRRWNPTAVGLTAALALTATVLAQGPVVQSAFPRGLPRGVATTVELEGTRLESVEGLVDEAGSVRWISRGKSERNRTQVTILAEPSAPLGLSPLRFRSPTGVSDLVVFEIESSPPVVLREPTNSPCLLAVGQTLDGWLPSDREQVVHCAVTAGEALAIELLSMHLGGPLVDTSLSVRDLQGHRIAAADDSPELGHDPVLRWTPKESGTVALHLETKSLDAPTRTPFRLRIEAADAPTRVRPRPGRGVAWQLPPLAETLTPAASEPGQPLRLRVLTSRRRDQSPVALPVGGRQCLILQTDARPQGEHGIELSLTGLPPGVHASYPSNLAPGATQFPLVLESRPQLERGAWFPGVSAHCRCGDPLAVSLETRVPISKVENDVPFSSITARSVVLALVRPVPIEIEADSPRAPVPIEGRASIEVRIQRGQGGDKPLTLRVLGLPDGISSAAKAVQANGQWATLELQVSSRAPLGTHALVVTATGDFGGEASVCSKLLALEVEPARVKVRWTNAIAASGTSLTMALPIEWNGPAPEWFEMEWSDLPTGVQGRAMRARGSDPTLATTLEIAATAAATRVRPLGLRLRFEDPNGRKEIRLRGGSLIVAPEAGSTGTIGSRATGTLTQPKT